MKNLTITFLKPNQSQVKLAHHKGFISATGKITLPLEFATNLFAKDKFCKVGLHKAGKTTRLFIAPTSDKEEFAVQAHKKSYSIALGSLLEDNGIDYKTAKQTFSIVPFDYEAQAFYELKLSTKAVKPVYAGKKRGRKPKTFEEPQRPFD